MGEERNEHRIVIGKLKYWITHKTPRCNWGDTVKMDLWETGCEGMDWIKLAQSRLQRRAVGNKAFVFHKVGEFFEQLSDYQLLKLDSVP
jgi:hypothetical protein